MFALAIIRRSAHPRELLPTPNQSLAKQNRKPSQLIENNHQHPKSIASFCRLFLDYAASQPINSPARKARVEAGGVTRRALRALSRAQSRGTPNQIVFFFVAPAFQLVLTCARRRQSRMFFRPYEANRTASGGPARSLALVVNMHALCGIFANADIKRIVGAAKNVAVVHEDALRLAQTSGSLRAKFRKTKFWRRGELNPRPRNLATRSLHAYPVPLVSLLALRTGKTR